MSHASALLERKESLSDEWKIQVPIIAHDETCKNVLERFLKEDHPPCIVVCDHEGIVIGLVMREQFYPHLTGRFAAELFYDRAVWGFADRQPLIVDASRQPVEVIDAALAREQERFYDCVILTRDGRFDGVLTVQHLMMMSRQLQQDADDSRHQVLASSREQIHEIGGSAGEVASAAERSLKLTGHMMELTEDGRMEMHKIRQSFERVLSIAALQTEQMNNMLHMANDILRIAGAIRGLADRSGMLAMNAAIEASHAGEHGRGFSVVAREVKSLAAQTKSFSDEIGVTLEQVSELVSHAASLSSDSAAEMQQSQACVKSADDTFQALIEAVRAVDGAEQEMSGMAAKARSQAASIFEELRSLI
ncbi:methyl-accepting chemotaxis protein [Paenibacillus caui]|uniref:methyl-accepting chemotaxis protein n=1 Tax=Paenibacillus caui TaxID=2873927 RepID=UPI001CAA09C2|nr:methyl-accepting chemotaxis protein [Paenibacillus caui]